MAPLFEITKPQPTFVRAHKIIHGPPKSGKTTLASHLTADGKPPAFLLTEDGHKALEIHALRIRSWEEFLRAKAEIIKRADDFRAQFSTLVIDLCSELDEMAAAYVLRQNNINHPAELPHGKGWYLVKETFRAGNS